MAKFGAREEDLCNHRLTPPVKEFLAYQIGCAHHKNSRILDKIEENI